MRWIIYWAAVIVIAISAFLFVDFAAPGIGMLVFLLIFANACYHWEHCDRVFWQSAAAHHQPVVEVPHGEPTEVAMAYIHFDNGDTQAIMNLETDYKVGEDMKFYEKNKRHNRWDQIPNVACVEFNIYEMDEVATKQS